MIRIIKSIFSILIIVLLCGTSYSQVICPKNHHRILFGPRNVIIEKSDPSRFYINEIDNVLDSLLKKEKLTTSTILDNNNNNLKEDIKAIKSIRKEWTKWSESNDKDKVNLQVEVKEFFDRIEIQNRDAMKIRGAHYDIRNCLRSNPDDCFYYGRIKKWKIKIEDDYGNLFIPDFHSFSNVGFSTHSNGSEIFYRVRLLED